MIERLLPAFGWLRRYRRADLRGDLVAGVTVGVMLVPQGMAYAMLAGLPPVVGLYASTIPLVVYALFGSSHQLAVGPVAMVSLLVMTACSELAEPGSMEYIAHAALLALMVGGAQLLLGLLRAGFITNFVSHGVVSGFTSAAAIVICLSQVKHLLGVDPGPAHSTVGTVAALLREVHGTRAGPLAIGVLAIVVLAVLRRYAPRAPGALIVVAAGGLVVWLLGSDRIEVGVVGEVPTGLPGFALPTLGFRAAGRLVPAGLVIVFVGYMESIAVAELIAARERQHIDSDAELRGLGLANLAAGLFSGYPVTGGFSRTAVNYQAGARTGLAGIVTAAIVVLTLLFLTPLFRYLPKAVLAAIITVAVAGLIDVRTARKYFRVKPADGWALAITFAATLALSIEWGIVVGVAFSLLVFIWRSAYPHIAHLGLVRDGGIFRNVDRYPEAEVCREAVILRIDASLYFANMGFVEDRLREALAGQPDVRWVILDLAGVNDIDAVAIDRLEELMDSCRERGTGFVLVEMKGPVRDLVARAGWDGRDAGPAQFRSLEAAVRELGLALHPPEQGS